MNHRKTCASIAIICLMLMATITVLGQNVDISENKELNLLNDYREDGIIGDELVEQINALISFFEEEYPEERDYLKDAFEEAKIFDMETGKLLDLNLTKLEEELISSRSKLKFFRSAFLWTESINDYKVVRTPYDKPYWNGPILGRFAIRWSFESKPEGTRKIEIYNDYYRDSLDNLQPKGNPIFYAERVWFHDFTSNPRWSWQTHRIGSCASFIWAIGGEEKDSNNLFLYQVVLFLYQIMQQKQARLNEILTLINNGFMFRQDLEYAATLSHLRMRYN